MKLKRTTELAIFLVIIALLTISCNFISNMPDGSANNNSEEEISLQGEPEEPTTEPTSEAAVAPTIEPTQKPPRSTPTSEETDNCMSESSDFQLSLPDSWICLDLTATDFEELFSTTFEANPQMGDLLSTDYLASLSESGIKLFAIFSESPSAYLGLYSNFTALSLELLLSVSLEDYVQLTTQQLESLVREDTEILIEYVYIGDFDAAKLTYESQFNDTFGNPMDLVFSQIIILENDNQYVFTLTSHKADFEIMEPLLMEIVQTFKIID